MQSKCYTLQSINCSASRTSSSNLLDKSGQKLPSLPTRIRRVDTHCRDHAVHMHLSDLAAPSYRIRFLSNSKAHQRLRRPEGRPPHHYFAASARPECGVRPPRSAEHPEIRSEMVWSNDSEREGTGPVGERARAERATKEQSQEKCPKVQ